jgi:glycosyltransferase involved in cell wall biosynthesis
MNIGVYVNQLDAKLGGAYTFEWSILRSLIDKLDNRGHKLILISDSGNSQIAALANEKTVSYIPLHNFGLLGKYSSRIRKVFDYWKEDFYLYPGHRYKKSKIEKKLFANNIHLVISLSPRVLSYNIPYFITLWDIEHLIKPYYPEVSQYGIWRDRENFYSKALKRAAKIFVGTQIGKDQIRDFYSLAPENISVNPFLINDFFMTENFQDLDIHKKYNLPPKFLFYPAQFWPHKNHVTLLKAIAKINLEKEENIHLVLSGSDKGNLKYIKKVINSLKIESYIHFVGFISESEILNFYKKAIALPYVSLFGPDNLPPLEAFAMNCPVIAHKTPGSEEQLGDAAYLLDTLDEHELENAIIKIISDQDFTDELKIKGKKKIKHLTADNYVARIIECINQFARYRSTWDIDYK